MEKYKVLTENLDWFNINKDDILLFNDPRFWINNLLLDSEDLSCVWVKKCIKLHPTWFEKIEEENTYTEQDMKNAFSAGINQAGSYFRIIHIYLKHISLFIFGLKIT